MISGAEATASYRRLGHIHGDVETLSSKADVAQADLSSIKNTLANMDTKFSADLSSIKSALSTMDAKLNTIIELLNTPQGLRPNFPIKK